ncbi:hypothetical protein [Streptomyces sp. DSM 15324]|uniref:hypothetical protein n=1 Tax=Streptomyces sp. DSM 15324 TaxID=1739111 RepID=UPI000747C500|nr:hypothetical protein [Streptomyces sp. DSM 15324]KUO09525.1 hypothetical protein AQJ58_24515 [Streptomyces sp. DSM 15324]
MDVVGLGLRWHDQCRDCMIAGIRLNWAAGRPVAGRHRVTVCAGERPMLEGWWDEVATAEDKTTRWIGAYGGGDRTRITLDDEATGTRLMSWPEEP